MNLLGCRAVAVSTTKQMYKDSERLLITLPVSRSKLAPACLMRERTK